MSKDIDALWQMVLSIYLNQIEKTIYNSSSKKNLS